MFTIDQNDAGLARCNIDLLAEELAFAGLPGPVLYRHDLAAGTMQITFDADPSLYGPALAVVQAHDPDGLSSEQAITLAAAAVDSEAEARTTPDFMGWTPDEAEAWVVSNVVDLPGTALALRQMARDLAALNGKVFPRLRVGG